MFLVHTDHGRIVYSVTPQHLIDRPGSTLRDRCICYGEQMAVCNADQWYARAYYRQAPYRAARARIRRLMPDYERPSWPLMGAHSARYNLENKLCLTLNIIYLRSC